MVLFPERIDRDIAENDPVRIINGVINGLNLDCLARLYRSKGRRAYNARMMLKVIIYAYMNNVYSCRKIENLLKRDIHFIWLAGYEQPDFITINRFRNRLKDEIYIPQNRHRKLFSNCFYFSAGTNAKQSIRVTPMNPALILLYPIHQTYSCSFGAEVDESGRVAGGGNNLLE